MTYITQQGLIDRGWERQLIQLTDKTNKPATTIDTTTVARHIGDASSTIDSYLAKRYALPLAAVPPVLEKIAADIAIYFAHGTAVDKDGAIAAAHREAIRWLDGVARGLVTIDGAGTAPAPSGGGQVKIAGPDRVFDRDSMGGF
jgi:phage gp36-like protein